MIAGWLLYCLAVSALLAIGAAMLDTMLVGRGRSARWVWAVAIVGSLIIPVASYLWQQHASPPPRGNRESSYAGLFSAYPTGARTLPAPMTLRALASHRPRAPEFVSADRIAVWVVIACIMLATLRVAFDSWLLYRGRRRWTPNVVDDVPVLVSDTLGPAIVGLLEPRIVLPRWTLSLDADERALVLLHEREHLRAHDGRLTTAALIAVVSMPWNPALWYALRRLRTAIEVDCDRRVLRASPDVRRYGGLLVAVAQRAVGSSLAIAGFSERAAPLARRIHAMTISTSRRLSLRDAGVGVLGAAALVASMLVLPPEAPARSFPGTSTQVQVFAKYVADSIATNVETPVFVGAARDLPVTFSVDQMRPTPGPRSAVDCPMSLRDDRDGTILHVRRSSGGVANIVRRGDTTWTHVRAIGFYAVRPEGRYGVAANQMLRVGCGSSTEIAIAGVPIPSNALSTLDSRDDDRARRIGRAISSLIHVEPIAVDLYTGRLEIVVGDTTAIANTSDAEWDFTYAVFARARDILGHAAMPETLSVALRRGRSQWMAMYYYKSMAK